MDTRSVLELYDRHERQEASPAGYRREEAECVVRLIDEVGDNNFIAYSKLDGPEEADKAIGREIAYFKGIKRPIEWKYYSHDGPEDLKDRLEAAGFKIGDDEAIMALDLAMAPEWPAPAPGFEIRRLADPGELGDVAAVHSAVWDEDFSPHIPPMASLMRDHADSLSVYVAYIADKPVCAAWIDFPEHSPFASLWGGSTLMDYRKRGIYSAMLAIRAREAQARGYRYLTIDAGPMSRPIVKRQGFELLAMSNPCNYEA